MAVPTRSSAFAFGLNSFLTSYQKAGKYTAERQNRVSSSWLGRYWFCQMRSTTCDESDDGNQAKDDADLFQMVQYHVTEEGHDHGNQGNDDDPNTAPTYQTAPIRAGKITLRIAQATIGECRNGLSSQYRADYAPSEQSQSVEHSRNSNSDKTKI